MSADIAIGLAEFAGALVLLIAGFFIYLLPATIAHKNKHKNKTAILTFNVFLGWTILGWVIALVWAQTNQPSQQSQANKLIQCSMCGKDISPHAVSCPHCGHPLR
jgi:Na+/H+-dicarboxylate symporter